MIFGVLISCFEIVLDFDIRISNFSQKLTADLGKMELKK